ncbi:MAG: DUF3141 domain-containing protein [Filomicrobium sp.]
MSDNAHQPWQTIASAVQTQSRLLNQAAQSRTSRGVKEWTANREKIEATTGRITELFRRAQAAGTLQQDYLEYLEDAGQRAVLTLDTLRQRGDIFFEHEAAGAPPVLIYDYDVVMDGACLPHPCNYMLLRIKPPEGLEVFQWKRPYVIIDPRAGHGPGIGGFKPDSQVGVALADGHPVYFVAFKQMPEQGQTLAAVTNAEAAFLREIRRLHPDSPKPVIVGNCQGGWATSILAATNPDLAGPIVLNGSPMAYWSGRLGQDLMRYNGGMLGGVLPAMVMSDVGAGNFDGAHLVFNFEMLNPGRTWFRKYFDLYADVDKGAQRFLDFERWWGGFYLMKEAEIRWIVESLFVGNKLSKGEARLETGRPIDIKSIRAPIIVFASHGDNITPPQQALNWIVDTFSDETEIEICGQRIIYMVHEQVGHLGIFVSSSVAKKEHSQMASTLKTIEALSPGLYEMKIDDIAGEGTAKQFTVSFHKRQMSDILAIDSGREEEVAFAAVARMSEQLAEIYETTWRPYVQAMSNEQSAQLARSLHPVRLKRTAFASTNPSMTAVSKLADKVRQSRKPARPDNPFVAAEELWADVVEQSWQVATDWRAFFYETAFLSLYAGPWGQWYGTSHFDQRPRKSIDELRHLPIVVDALHAMERGGLAEAVVRMLVLLANTRGNVRRDRLERSSQLLTSEPPFRDMDPATRAKTIHEQTLIAHFEPEQGLATLVKLIPSRTERTKAMEMVEYVLGSVEEMEPRSFELLNVMRRSLELPQLEVQHRAAQ